MPCGCINSDCSHRSSTVTSSSSTTTTTLCPDAIGNDSVYTDECVIYTGPTIDCFGIKNGANIFIALYQLLFLFDSSCTTTTTSTTSTTTSTTTTSTTTSSTTTTSTTTSSSTTTTTAPPCLTCVTFTNNTGTIVDAEYKNCQGLTISIALKPRTTVSYCGCCATAYGVAGVIIDQSSIPCVNGVCQPPTTTTTSTTVGPFETYCMGFTNSSTTLGVSMDYYDAFGVLHQPVLIVPPSSTVYVCASRTGGIPAEITVNVLPGSCLTRPECNPALPTTTTTSSTTSSTTTTTTTASPTTTTTTSSTTSTTTSTTTTSTTTTTTTFAPTPYRCMNVNSGFNTDLSGWEVTKGVPPGAATSDWVWDAGRAAFQGGDTGGYISQNMMQLGYTYRITFDLEIVNSGFLFNKSIRIYAGTAASPIINTIGLTSVDVTLMCTDTTYFSIYGVETMNVDGPSNIFIDNVCVEQTIPARPTTTTTTSTTTTSTTTTTTLAPTTTTTTSTTSTTTSTTTTSTTTTSTTLAPTTTTSTTTTTTTIAPTTSTTTTTSTTSTTTTTTLVPTTTTTTSTTSTTTSTTTTSTTTTTTTQFNFAKCADCVPTLAGITQGTQGLLNVGVLSSGLCTLGDFVIDWYLNSTSAPLQTFSSKNSGNTDITASQIHPFNVPSQSGTWIPVIKYITLDGIIYSPNGGAYSLSADLTTCLPTVSVTSLTCPAPTVGQPFYNDQGPSYAQYSHYFKYQSTNTSVAGDANKTMSMELNSDGSTKYLAWYFHAFLVSDRFKLSYVSPLLGTTTLLEDYVIGGNVTNNFTSTPRLFGGQGLRGVLNLSSITYNTGDRILIEVIGNHVEPTNAGTDWFIFLKCLNTFSTAWTKVAPPIACSSVLATVACTNKITVSFPSWPDNSTTDIFKYLYYNYSATLGNPLVNPTVAVPSVTKGLSVAGYTCSISSSSGTNTQTATIHPYTITKTGANVVLNFTNDVEYNIYRNSYLTAYNQNALTYSSDITLSAHFKFIFITLYFGTFEAPTNNSLVFHQTSNVVFFNDGTTRTMTIDMVNAGATNIVYPGGPCVSECNAPTYYTYTQNSINYRDCYTTSGSSSYAAKTVNTIWSMACKYVSYNGPTAVNAGTVTYADRGFDIYTLYIGSSTCVFNTTPTDWYAYTGTGVGHFTDAFFALKMTITDVNNPTTNFKVENCLNYTTHIYTSAVVSLLYEIVGGIVTTPSAGCP